MKIEVSRRKFLQGSVALTIVGGSTLGGMKLLAENSEKKVESIHEKIPTLCEMCVNKCATIAEVEDGILKKLDPNPIFPKSKNMLCPRGVAGVHALYDPDRLKYPMVRIGKRGEGKFKRVTWDEAYEAILNGTEDFKGLKEIIDEEKDNRSTIGYCAGEGMAEHTFKDFIFKKMGSFNFVNHASICLQTTLSAHVLTMGAYGQADLENANYVIMAGANRAEAIITPDTMNIFKRTRGRGVTLIVVDPRYTNTAVLADEWLGIKVGTDLAFVLALTYVAIKEGLYNKKFVEQNVNGFEEYKTHIISNNYTPQWAEKITGIKANKIIKIARDFMASAPRAIFYQGRRTAWGLQDFQFRRASAIFSALGGGVDIKGGIVFGKKLALPSHPINAPFYANAKLRVDKGVASMLTNNGSWIGWRNRIIEKKTPYPVRAIFTYKQNPMLSVPNVAKTKKLFEMMDLVVTIDTMPSDTVIMSDVVLPECTYLEREDPIKSFGGVEPSIALRQKVIEPLYESKPVFEILQGLAKKISHPLWEISKKYNDDIDDDMEAYAEDGFDLTDMFAKSQEEINKELFTSKYGETAYETLKEKGVYYPNMDKYFKKISENEYSYYPEEKKYYSVLKENLQSELYRGDCVDFKELASTEGKVKTKSGKVECNLTFLTEKGTDAMPTWQEKLYKETPTDKFRFITGRHAQFTQNSTSNNAMLLDLVRENYIWINKNQADKLGIDYGDEVEVKSSTGEVRIKAYPTNKIIEDVVFYVHGFGANSDGLTLGYRNGASDNMIIKDDIETVFGTAVMHETNVEIRKV